MIKISFNPRVSYCRFILLIRLVADRSAIKADRNDLSYVIVEITDEKGKVIPNWETLVQFSISGNGELPGVGNGNPSDMASFQQPQRKTFRGRYLAVLRPK